VAERLTLGHIDSLEVLELLRPLNLKIIYDIGANVGTWTLLAKAIFPMAEVHAFEPLAIHQQGFQRDAGHLPGVHLHKVALGDVAGHETMQVTDFSDASSLLPLSEAGQQEWRVQVVAREEVHVERLDDWRCEALMPFPSLIKLDVQGFELAVLRGAVRCVEQATAVLAEVSFRKFYEGQPLFQDVAHFLSERDFSLYALGQRTEVGNPLMQADALFVANRAVLLER
jgi:FkbM family methyltransferase